eukprot:4977789-Karenia_brevis.AAC.1
MSCFFVDRRSLNDLLHDASGRSSPLPETHRCFKKLPDMSASILFKVSILDTTYGTPKHIDT